MLIKTHPAMTVLFNTHHTKLGELENIAGTSVKELYKYVADLDLLVCGPQYWFYYGVDGRPETRFTLEVAIPVHGRIPTALLPYFKELPPLKCLSFIHEGPWSELACVYKKMMAYISENGLTMNGIYAEVYLNTDIPHPARNITEVQIGLA